MKSLQQLFQAVIVTGLVALVGQPAEAQTYSTAPYYSSAEPCETIPVYWTAPANHSTDDRVISYHWQTPGYMSASSLGWESAGKTQGIVLIYLQCWSLVGDWYTFDYLPPTGWTPIVRGTARTLIQNPPARNYGLHILPNQTPKAGYSFYFTWTAPAGHSAWDFVSVAPAGGGTFDYYSTSYTKAGTRGSSVLQLARGGTWQELRLQRGSDYAIIARSPAFYVAP